VGAIGGGSPLEPAERADTVCRSRAIEPADQLRPTWTTLPCFRCRRPLLAQSADVAFLQALIHLFDFGSFIPTIQNIAQGQRSRRATLTYLAYVERTIARHGVRIGRSFGPRE
jgi:hypothetical protein